MKPRQLANPFDAEIDDKPHFFTHNQLIALPKHIPAKSRVTIRRILLVPETLRTSDPSFLTELESGQMGLSGNFMRLDPEIESPFDIETPTPDFERDLHDFRWLRHLSRAAEVGVPSHHHPAFYARKFVSSWIGHSHKDAHFVSEPQVFSRRVLAWITHSRLLLEGAPDDFYKMVMNSLGEQIYTIASDYQHLNDPAHRLHFLTILLFVGLTVAGQEDFYERYKGEFAAELAEQFNEDGMHLSSNPKTLKAILMDFVPLQHCMQARDKPSPPGFDQKLAKMMQMLRFLRMGDGKLARFCGTGSTYTDEVTALMSFDRSLWEAGAQAKNSGFFRLSGGETLLLAKTAAAPSLEFSHEAHADQLSFEMTVGPFPVIVNCGTPRHDDSGWRHNARRTSAHSTLTINETEAARFVEIKTRKKSRRTIMGLQGPVYSEGKLSSGENSHKLVASHDGFKMNFGVVYSRTLELALNGLELTGEEKLNVEYIAEGENSFAVHFHLHPDVLPEKVADDTILLTLHDGEVWHFSVRGADCLIADSVFLGLHHGPMQTKQIVLVGPLLKSDVIVGWTMIQNEYRKRKVAKGLGLVERPAPKFS